MNSNMSKFILIGLNCINDPANIRLGEDVLKTSSRRLQDVFSVTFFCLLRRLEDITAIRLARRLEDVLKTF